MSGEIFRDLQSLDFYTTVIGVTLLFHIILRYAYRFEYQNFLRKKPNPSPNSLIIFWVSNFCYYGIMALILMPYIHRFELPLEPTELNLFFYTFLVLLAFNVIQWCIKFIWYQSYGYQKDFSDALFRKTYVQFLKYILALIFLILFVYSPLKQWFSPILVIILFLGLYIFEVLFEFMDMPNGKKQSGFIKFLYLCTLEILPVLVFMKLLLL